MSWKEWEWRGSDGAQYACTGTAVAQHGGHEKPPEGGCVVVQSEVTGVRLRSRQCP